MPDVDYERFADTVREAIRAMCTEGLGVRVRLDRGTGACRLMPAGLR